MSVLAKLTIKLVSYSMRFFFISLILLTVSFVSVLILTFRSLFSSEVQVFLVLFPFFFFITRKSLACTLTLLNNFLTFCVLFSFVFFFTSLTSHAADFAPSKNAARKRIHTHHSQLIRVSTNLTLN